MCERAVRERSTTIVVVVTMSSDASGSDNIHPGSRWLATWLIGSAVLGLSLLGASFALPRQIWKMKKKKKPIRVYMDGCFDMMHYGHCNALRQARALGDQLVVGVVSDAEIILNKGPPVTPLNERFFPFFFHFHFRIRMFSPKKCSEFCFWRLIPCNIVFIQHSGDMVFS